MGEEMEEEEGRKISEVFSRILYSKQHPISQIHLFPRRMQLVVMATVLAAAVAGQGCRFGCRPTNISFPVDSCGVTEFIYTTICAGHCYHEDPVYISHDDWAEQSVCSGEWAYEVKQLQGCPLAVTYPVARSCECSACNAANTHCGHFHGYVPSCVM
ncbi:gonadotropin subunit beta-1-like isoform X5 [Betta splendens]|uniref:Gonadotropin subunit beta-1-like isoform X5 n=1 Tax=Betta splendens TaxID=158456 RepID=A0A9W2XPM2_BETSP|nr:gonadotropin subunit beta-1-like isoform X5 [Betta splendens]